MRDCKRIGFGTIERADSSDDSFPLKVKITLAKVGVLPYIRADGTITNEAKLPEDLFHADTVATLKGAPITMEHPPGLVTIDNSKELVKGSVLDSIQEKDGTLVGNGSIFDKVLIGKLKGGEKKEVSIGFTHKLEKKDGEIDGVTYDHIQREIRVNHVAATDSGRAGPSVAIHLDSNNDLAVEKTAAVEKEIKKMAEGKKVVLTLDADIIKKLGNIGTLIKSKDNEHLGEAAEQIGEVAAGLQAALEKAPPPDSISELAAAKQEIATLEAQVQNLQAVIEAAKAAAEAATSPETMNQLVQERAEVVKTAESLIKEFDGKGKDGKIKTNKQIMVEVANEILPTKDGETKITTDSKEEFIRNRYEAAVEVARYKSLNGASQKNGTHETTDAAELEKLQTDTLNMKGKFGPTKKE